MIETKKFQVNEASIQYQARTALANLANEIAAIRVTTSPEFVNKAKRAAKIRYWLKALDYKEFISLEKRNQIWYKLIEISGIYDFPTAPVLGERTRPAILVGEQGPPGDTGPTGGSGGTPFVNTDVDTGTEVVDSFAYTLGTGAIWQYTIRNAADTASRSGEITATWLADGSSVGYGADITGAQVGDTSDVTLSVDTSAGNIRLKATSLSNNWSVSGSRLLIS